MGRIITGIAPATQWQSSPKSILMEDVVPSARGERLAVPDVHAVFGGISTLIVRFRRLGTSDGDSRVGKGLYQRPKMLFAGFEGMMETSGSKIFCQKGGAIAPLQLLS